MKTISPEQFATTLVSAVGEPLGKIDESMAPAVRKACQSGRKAIKSELPAGLHQGETYARYASGFSYRVKRNGHLVSGEIGNQNVPGLVHLLEHGHAKVGGGRTRAFPHMFKGEQEAREKLVEEIGKAVEEAV